MTKRSVKPQQPQILPATIALTMTLSGRSRRAPGTLIILSGWFDQHHGRCHVPSFVLQILISLDRHNGKRRGQESN